MADLSTHPSVARVRQALSDLGISARIRILDDAVHTARAAAQALGVQVAQIANSLVFIGAPADGAEPQASAAGEPLLVLTSGAHRVDTEQLAVRLGLGALARADARTVREVTGFPIGGVAPVGHPAPIRTLVDVTLGEYDTIWAAAGHPRSIFPTTYTELLRVTNGQPIAVD
jgi:prolyl-tRNA editing enzyme YbaK/EbsC (Cys-tRNA(Pro) deacylase)